MRVDATSLPVKAARYLKVEHTAPTASRLDRRQKAALQYTATRAQDADTGRSECRSFLETLTDVRECFSVPVSEG